MTPIWSKIMESFVAGYTLIETKKHWKINQHGGKKGSGVDHVLIKMWNTTLKALEPNGGQRSVVMCGVDFSKSFSRCSFQEILLAYKRLKAPQWIINMHAAFLKNRSMQVKVGNTLSLPVEITGGAVQGSIMGVMDHNAVLEDIDDDFQIDATEKYVDDLSLIHI